MHLSRRLGIAAMAAALTLGVTACGGDDAGSAAGTATAAGGNELVCGKGAPDKATGEPIKFGAIYAKQPGLDFSNMVNAAQAYFDCVNDHGGIHGRPIQYLKEDEQTNPQQVASLATKLVEDDKVLALVANASLVECSVNSKYYEQQGMKVVAAGIPNDCFQSPAIAPVNAGPQLSELGAAQYLIKQGAKSIVISSVNGPGAEASMQGAILYARSKGLKAKTDLQSVPIADPNAVALRLAEEAGDGGGVILAYPPPESLKILKGVEAQGLIDKVHWGCPTSCNDTALVKALSPAWNGKLAVNAELNLADANDPDDKLYRAVIRKYAPSEPLGSFGQMGFLAAKIVADALAGAPESQLTKEGVNKSIQDVNDYKTGILCTPWYFGDGDVHIPNSTTRTIVPKDGKWVEQEGCFQLEAVTPEMKAVRQYEQEHGM